MGNIIDWFQRVGNVAQAANYANGSINQVLYTNGQTPLYIGQGVSNWLNLGKGIHIGNNRWKAYDNYSTAQVNYSEADVYNSAGQRNYEKDRYNDAYPNQPVYGSGNKTQQDAKQLAVNVSEKDRARYGEWQQARAQLAGIEAKYISTEEQQQLDKRAAELAAGGFTDDEKHELSQMRSNFVRNDGLSSQDENLRNDLINKMGKLQRKIGDKDFVALDVEAAQQRRQQPQAGAGNGAGGPEKLNAFMAAMREANLAQSKGDAAARYIAETKALTALEAYQNPTTGTIELPRDAVAYLFGEKQASNADVWKDGQSPAAIMVLASANLAMNQYGKAIDQQTLTADVMQIRGGAVAPAPAPTTGANQNTSGTAPAVTGNETKLFFDSMKAATEATTPEARIAALKTAEDAMTLIKSGKAKLNAEQIPVNAKLALLDKFQTTDEEEIKKGVAAMTPEQIMIFASERYKTKDHPTITQADIDAMHAARNKPGNIPPRADENGQHTGTDANTTGTGANATGANTTAQSAVPAALKTADGHEIVFNDKYGIVAKGMADNSVVRAQMLMESLGIQTDKGGANDGVVDGVVGAETRKAIAAIEAQGEIAGHVKGTIDAALLQALEAKSADALKTKSGQQQTTDKPVLGANTNPQPEIIDETTVEAVRNDPTATTFKSQGETGQQFDADVAEAQKRLQNLGYDVTPTGTRDVKTDDALRMYAQTHNLDTRIENIPGIMNVVLEDESLVILKPVKSTPKTNSFLTEKAAGTGFSAPTEIDDEFVKRASSILGFGAGIKTEADLEKSMSQDKALNVKVDGQLSNEEMIAYLDKYQKGTNKPEFDSLLKEYGIERKADASYAVASTSGGDVGMPNGAGGKPKAEPGKGT